MKKFKDNILKIFSSLISNKNWRRLTKIASGITVFITVYMLILPALTLEHDTAVDMPGISDIELWEDSFEDQEMALDETWEEDDDFLNGEQPDLADGQVEYGFAGAELSDLDVFDLIEDEEMEDLTESLTEVEFPGEEDIPESPVIETGIGALFDAVTEVSTEKAAETEVMTEKTSETEVMTEKTSETEVMTETETAAEAATEEATEKAAEETTEQTTEEVTEKATEETSEKTTEEVTEYTTEKATENTTEEATEDVTEGETEAVTEAVSEEAEEALTEDITEEMSETEEVVNMPAQKFHSVTSMGEVHVEAGEGAFPEGTTMRIRNVTDEEIIQAVTQSAEQDTEAKVSRVFALDITFYNADGEEIQPLVPIRVNMTDRKAPAEGEAAVVVHVDQEGNTDLINDIQVEDEAGKKANVEVSFDAEKFSVYAVAYTVDFHWEVDGQIYDFSIPGGSCVQLSQIVEILGIGGSQAAEQTEAEDTVSETEENAEIISEDEIGEDSSLNTILNVQVSDRTREFVENVETVAFSDPDLVWVGKVESDTTVGELKATAGLEAEYSAGLGEAQVSVINSQVLQTGDWALISLLPFLSEESLTVTMKNGEVFTIVVTDAQITERYMTASGETYVITVTYDQEAGIPDDARLSVSEITEDLEAYGNYVEKAEEALGWETGTASYIRIFDIKILDHNGNKVEIQAPVDVKVELADKEDGEEAAQVVHFADGSETGEVVTFVEDEGETVSFVAEGFSAYAIVEGPEAIELGWNRVETLDDLTSGPVYIGHVDGYYFMNTTVTDSKRVGIRKTKPAQNNPGDGAAAYFFEKVEGSDNQFYVYCMGTGDVKQYVYNNGNNSLSFTDETNKTAFTITVDQQNVFRVNNGAWYWNMQGGASGERFCSYNSATDVNAKLYIWYKDQVDQDPYNLDGKSYGLMNWNNSVAGKALMASSSSAGTLDAKALTVMRTADNSDQLFAPNDSDISMWKFQWIEDDRYYLTADVNGSTRYLSIGQNGLSLVSTPDDSCRIQVVPGTGIHAGEICLKASGSTLTFSGTVANGFGIGGSVGSEWLHLVDLSELTSDYFRTYSANKVSVSSEDVTNGSRVIVYTRSWNEVSKKYDFYAIGSDGTLVPVYETGDSIEWVSGQINQLLWNFVEYYWEGTEDPNFYYELYNQYSEKFLAPQVTDGQILSDDTIGINLNGRRDGKYYSTIMAWDDESYSYTGLKVEDGHIVSCPKSEAMDFYFAIMQDLNVDDTLTSVPTVDNNQYGITMKLTNLKTRDEMSSYLGSNDGGAVTTTVPGLLSTDLKGNGYPDTAGGSLESLYKKYSLQDVNHLFIDSIYQSSGYFMYDSTQNFASLNNGNNFTVYKEIGTYDSAGARNTLKHGEFFPFNDLKPGVFASINGKNLYDAMANELPDSDPRKYEQLYLIEHDGKKADTYFAMELEASFTQTPSGLDAWGHDIIFEFTGDDDFWLYVDGELVIDLGGIHSAIPGWVNFRTGQVYVNRTYTTLKDLFYENYLGRGNQTTPAQAQAYVNGIFEENENGQFVFKDYTNHTMRIFYMERGAGASNLKMRFNLAAVKKNTVQLNKKLSGVDTSESVMAEFPYQILYKKSDSDGEFYLKNAVAKRATQNDDYVYYMDTVNPVHYEESFTIDGIVYNDVFFLKPDETAEINFPEDTVSYKIIECGVNTNVYDKVEVNNTEVTGTGSSTNRKDFGIDYASTDERAKVNYVNHVDPNALKTLTFKKKLFKEDGTTEISYNGDHTLFSFRLYLASEFGTLDAANMHTYHVKDPNGNYCSWDKAGQQFVKIGDGITSYEALTAEQKKAASFTTSIYGQVSKIPVGHTIEVRNVLAGTQYRVEERTSEIPDGYSFQKYDNFDNEHASEMSMSGIQGINGTVVTESDANVDVCNLKGWGLRMYKVWTDADYMAQRDAAYFAVYTEDTSGNLTLVEGTVRQLQWNVKPQTLYWYFRTLPVTGVSFDHYLIREVKISNSNPTIGEDGIVTNYGTITWVEDKGELKINGKQKGESAVSEFTYTVTYEKGTQDADSNVRVDMVTNNRPGIVLKKQDWSGHALAGATFTLHDNSENLIGTFTSDEEGMITVAFLRDDVDYVLTETIAPQSYHGLQNAMTVRLNNGQVTVTGVDSNYYTLEEPAGGTPTLTVKNRPYRFEAVKIDADSGEPLKGVEFALHRQVTVDGVTTIDLNPMPGYESLITDDNGIIPRLDNRLPAGTYELREKSTLAGYEMLPAYIQFTISATGTVSLISTLEEVTLKGELEGNDGILYRMTVKNSQSKKVSFVKVDIANTDQVLEGAVFDLYVVDIINEEEVVADTPLYTGLVSGEDGLLKDNSGNNVFDLPLGRYHLVETAAPAGYLPKSSPVVIDVKVSSVDYNEGTSLSDNNSGRSFNTAAKVYTLKISNSAGIELPSTGGIGTHMFYLIGFILVIGAGLVLAAQALKRKNLIEG